MITGQSEDTICAISTPPGVGGIAVVRVSGPDATAIVDKMWKGRRLSEVATHTAHLGTITGDDGEVLDQCVATVFRGPRSFTGEDVVELSVHGSVWIQRQTVNRLIQCGCRLATPGEFTRRAFASGRMDLAEAEGVADLIASSSRASHRLAVSQMRGHFSSRLHELRERLLELSSLLELELDFSEEEVEFAPRGQLTELARNIYDLTSRLADSFATGSAIKNGVPVAIVGATNAGKSTILNQLLHDDRAIVSDIHGTTRDTIEDTIEIGGVLFRLIDTAGLRNTSDTIESLGIERALSELDKAEVVVWVVDCSDMARNAEVWSKIRGHLTPSHRMIVARNKVDLIKGGSSAEGSATSGDESRAEGSFGQGSGAGAVAGPIERSGPVGVSNLIGGAGKAEQVSGLIGESEGSEDNAFEAIVCGQDGGADLDGGYRPFRVVDLVAQEGKGIEELSNAMVDASGIAQVQEGDVMVTNARHYEALTNASQAMSRVLDSLAAGISGDFIAQDLRACIDALSAITGAISTPEILSTIFSRFCIGK